MYYLEHFDLLFGQSSLEVLSGFAQPVDEESNHDKEDNHSWRSNNRVVNMVVEQKVVMPCIVLSFVPVTKRSPGSPESDHETGKIRTGIRNPERNFKSVQNSKSLSTFLAGPN